MFVASSNKQSFHRLRVAPTKDGKQVDIETFFQDPQRLDLNDAVVLTDDKPILELLNIPGGKVWRNTYIKMTNAFYKEGVPLFR